VVKATIRLYEVPAEFREQAHDMVYICEHFYSKVVDNTEDTERGNWLHRLPQRPPRRCLSGVLWIDCEKLPNVRFEILPWPIQRGPIAVQGHNERVNPAQKIFTTNDYVGLKPAEGTFLPS